MMDLGEFAKLLEEAAANCRPRLEVALGKIGVHTQELAISYIGREMAEWPPLKPATVTEKRRLGYTGQISPTDPLLRTGANRDSIRVEVEGLMMAVGSNRPEFLWMEMGTVHVPPRPSIAMAMLHALPHAETVLGTVATSLLSPRI
jgi:hypothetical protein